MEKLPRHDPAAFVVVLFLVSCLWLGNAAGRCGDLTLECAMRVTVSAAHDANIRVFRRCPEGLVPTRIPYECSLAWMGRRGEPRWTCTASGRYDELDPSPSNL
jgi:hypothetical protein